MRIQRCHTNPVKDSAINHNARVTLLKLESSNFTSTDFGITVIVDSPFHSI